MGLPAPGSQRCSRQQHTGQGSGRQGAFNDESEYEVTVYTAVTVAAITCAVPFAPHSLQSALPFAAFIIDAHAHARRRRG